MQNSKQAFTAGAISAFNLFPQMPKPQLTQQGWRIDRENLAQDWRNVGSYIAQAMRKIDERK